MEEPRTFSSVPKTWTQEGGALRSKRPVQRQSQTALPLCALPKLLFARTLTAPGERIAF